LDRFSFCKTRFDYDIESSPEKNSKNCFISVTKEALSNIIKHSNATEVHIRLSEHPALYQLIIHDNGSNCSYNNENGIGIRNISDRVAAIGGNVNISTEKGFRIFISVQKNSRKGEKNYEGSSNR
jgi:signal transduction histidine kinase